MVAWLSARGGWVPPAPDGPPLRIAFEAGVDEGTVRQAHADQAIGIVCGAQSRDESSPRVVAGRRGVGYLRVDGGRAAEE